MVYPEPVTYVTKFQTYLDEHHSVLLWAYSCEEGERESHPVNVRISCYTLTVVPSNILRVQGPQLNNIHRWLPWICLNHPFSNIYPFQLWVGSVGLYGEDKDVTVDFFPSLSKLCLSTHVPSFNPTSPPMHTHTHPHPHTSIPAMMVPIRYGMTKWFHKLMNQVSTSVAGSSKGQLMNTRGPEEEHLIAHPTTHKILPSLYTAVRGYMIGVPSATLLE